jgi:hypothetical protein
MQTATEIANEQAERLARAREYERLLGEKATLTRWLEVGNKVNYRKTIKALETIIEACNDISPDVHGSIGGLVPVSGIAQTFLSALATSALGWARAKQSDIDADIPKTKDALKRTVEALKEFES